MSPPPPPSTRFYGMHPDLVPEQMNTLTYCQPALTCSAIWNGSGSAKMYHWITNPDPTLFSRGLVRIWGETTDRSSVCLFLSVSGYANQLRKAYILNYQQVRTVCLYLIAHTIYLIFQNLHIIERPISVSSLTLRLLRPQLWKPAYSSARFSL